MKRPPLIKSNQVIYFQATRPIERQKREQKQTETQKHTQNHKKTEGQTEKQTNNVTKMFELFYITYAVITNFSGGKV